MTVARGLRPLRMTAGLLAVLLFGAACAGTGSTAGSSAKERPFEGETIHFVVSFAPGGGYDVIARAIAPYLEKETGATVVVENEDGAGGLLAANQVFAAEPDGLTIGFYAGQGIAGASLGQAQGAQYDLLDYSYVCRLAADTRVMTTSSKSEHKSIQDVLQAEGLQWGTAGTGAADHLDATVLTNVLDLDGEVVSGFDGSEATALAVTSGKVDIGSGSLSSKLEAIDAGDERPLLVIGRERVDDLQGVPALPDLDLDAQERSLADAHTKLQEMGRMVLAPPGVPEAELAALGRAFQEASENPKLTAKLAKVQLPIQYTSGPEAKKVAESVLDAPEDYQSLLEDAYRSQ